MIKSILFDLDGTLLPFDQNEFTLEYLRHIGAYMAPYIEPQIFIQQLLSSTNVMIANRGKKTNQQIFWEDFLPRIGVSGETILPVVDRFYEQHFSQIQSVARPSKEARKAVLAATAKGCDVSVATNPIFPANAVRQRLEWAGVASMPFKLITSYENSCYCKPHAEYYLEVANKIGRHPEECLMIGNDVEEDLIARTVGMKTYLVTDCLINTKGIPVHTDYIGTLAELADNLPSIIEG